MKNLKMKIYEIKERDEIIIDKLYKLWERSVRYSHLFLTEDDIKNISKYVKPAIINIKHLIAAEYESKIIGMMGIENQVLEILFLDPMSIGKGFGRALIEYGINNYNIKEVTVNEQNTNALNFYKHIGFKAYKRNEYDELGNHFPIIYMRL